VGNARLSAPYGAASELLTQFFVNSEPPVALHVHPVMNGGNPMADPRECRARALQCAALAQSTSSARLQELLTDLTRTWLRIAVEVERDHARLGGAL
jgi:hypothetical protein